MERGGDHPLSVAQKCSRGGAFVAFLLLFCLWDLAAVLLQFLLLRWVWVPTFIIGLSVGVGLLSLVLFVCVFRYSLFPLAMLRLAALTAILVVWSWNILRWYSQNRSPGWANGMDTLWTDTQALGYNYIALFVWATVAGLLLFLALFAHYLPRMGLFHLLLNQYTRLAPQYTEDVGEELPEINNELQETDPDDLSEQGQP